MGRQTFVRIMPDFARFRLPKAILLLLTAAVAAAIVAGVLFQGRPADGDQATEDATDKTSLVEDYLRTRIAVWIDDPLIIEAIIAQNQAHADLSDAEIDALDKQWRAEVDSGRRGLLRNVLDTPLSRLLKQKQAQSNGLITEIFVVDNKGLNVGQSDVTTDYWQGDEAKFLRTFGVGRGAIFVDKPEIDQSTGLQQAQGSMTIIDAEGKPIGAVTVGVDLHGL